MPEDYYYSIQLRRLLLAYIYIILFLIQVGYTLYKCYYGMIIQYCSLCSIYAILVLLWYYYINYYC